MERSQIPGCVAFLVGVSLLTGLHARAARADFTFGEPVNLGPTINSALGEWGGWLSTDGLSLYFCRPPSASAIDALWVSTRPTIHDPWETPVNLGPLSNWLPCKSIQEALGLTTADGLEQYGWGDNAFWGTVGYGGLDIHVLKRETMDDDWGTPQNLGSVVNSSADEACVSISPDGLEMYFSGSRNYTPYVRPGGSGQSDLWMTTRATRDEPWGQPVNLGSVVNSTYPDLRPSLSADGLLLFYDSLRPGGQGHEDLYMTRRATLSDPWQTPINLGQAVNNAASDLDCHVSADGSLLVFNSTRSGGYGGYDLWQTSITPIVDFNADSVVDVNDLKLLIDNWETTDTLCDIGPMPWGDGVVDIQDLKVFIAEWEKTDAQDLQNDQ